MKYRFIIFLVGLMFILNRGLSQSAIQSFDIVVYGGTSGGVMAAYTAKKLGKTVLLIEPGKHVGGLTTGGLGYTDIGNKYAITGLSRDFYRRIGAHYGKFEQWIFEPHVADQTFQYYIHEARLDILFGHRLVSVNKKNGVIISITIENSFAPGAGSYQQVNAKQYIDCSYEGDLMAKAGVSYFTGRESDSLYNEKYNGVQQREKHQFPEGVDPYVKKGDATSGLLWGIRNDQLKSAGTGDRKIQAYNFRLCLTSDSSNRILITQPAQYDASRYELLLRYLEVKPATDLNAFLKMDKMPNHKTDINNNGPFSTDMIGMNYDYPEGSYELRKKIQQAHEEYIKGFLYFAGHDERMPEHLRQLMLQWGYPKDEYTDNGNWSPQMYVREARRMKGAYVMTEANCTGIEVVQDGVGMAAYTMDSHNCDRLVVNGMVKNEGDVQIGGFGPYPVSYRSIIPKTNECTNLLVPVCLSATHIAYGSIRMEPVFMVLSQSAAVAAVLAVDNKTTIQNVDVKKLQKILIDNPLADNSTVEILVDDADSLKVTYTGNWKSVHSGSYGPSMLVDDGDFSHKNTVKFSPEIVKAGNYHLYAYFPKIQHASTQFHIDVFDGKNKKEWMMKEKDIRVEGQTSGEWISLGSYHLPAGSDTYTEISNQQADGVVVADAVLYVPDFK